MLKRIIILLLTLTFFISCNRDEVERLNQGIVAKWGIKSNQITSFKSLRINVSKNTKLSTNSEENFIEFYEDNEFLFVFQEAIFGGKYLLENNNIRLVDYGITLSNVSVNGDKLVFNLDIDGKSVSVQTEKYSEKDLDRTTEMLCKKWEIDLPLYRSQNAEDEFLSNYFDDVKSIYVRFSKYGTYLVHTVYDKGEEEYMPAYWNWGSDSNEINYLFDKNDEFSGGKIKISEISDEKLIIIEEIIEPEKTYTYITNLKSVK